MSASTSYAIPGNLTYIDRHVRLEALLAERESNLKKRDDELLKLSDVKDRFVMSLAYKKTGANPSCLVILHCRFC